MKTFFAIAVAFVAVVVLAESATYNDLGDYAGQTESTSDGFWDTTGRSSIAIERTSSANAASGFDSRTKSSDESDAAITVRRRPFGFVLSVR